MSQVKKALIVLKPQKKYHVLDLFCGCGGFSEGLTQAGLEVIAGIDYWDVAMETYKLNQKHLGLCKDLTQYSPNDFAIETGISSIDLLVGGFPCQGFSMGKGKRDVNDPRNSLFMEFVRYLDYFQPKGFIAENVGGLLSMKTANGDKCLDVIMSHFTQKYHCQYFKLSASDYEVPQNRVRVIFIGIRKDYAVTINEPPKSLSLPTQIAVRSILQPQSTIDQKYFLSQNAIDGIKARSAKMRAKGYGFGAKCLDLDKPCVTIPARYWKDGYDALVKYSDTDIRRLTEKELSLIQTFPATYQFCGSKKDVIIQIGNAVACRFAYHLGKYMINLLNQCP